jgi:transketolase
LKQGHSDYWYKYVGIDGRVVGMTTFGESAPGGKVMEHFGFTVENVVDAGIGSAVEIFGTCYGY